MALRLALEIDGNTRFRLDVHKSKISYYGLTFQIHPETDLPSWQTPSGMQSP